MGGELIAILGTAARATMDAALKGRADIKRQFLIEELSSGNLSMFDVTKNDELLSCVYQFDVAAMKGAADYKLKLMARVLRGQIEGGALTANEFLNNAEMIAALSEEEIKLVATLYKAEKDNTTIGDFMERTEQVMLSVCASLVPRVFADIDMMNSVAVAAQRTGLIIYTNLSFGATTLDRLVSLRTTARMAKFAEIARFETLGLDL